MLLRERRMRLRTRYEIVFLALLLAAPASGQGTVEAPAIFQDGLDLCVRNGTSHEAYRRRLQQLGATIVPEAERGRKPLERTLDPRDVWRVQIGSTAYWTFYSQAFSCTLWIEGEPRWDESDRARLIEMLTRKLGFVYHHSNPVGPVSREPVYNGRIDNERVTIIVAPPRFPVVLTFYIDRLHEDFMERMRAPKPPP